MNRTRLWAAGIYAVLAGIPTVAAYWKSTTWGLVFTAVALLLPLGAALVVSRRAT